MYADKNSMSDSSNEAASRVVNGASAGENSESLNTLNTPNNSAISFTSIMLYTLWIMQVLNVFLPGGLRWCQIINIVQASMIIAVMLLAVRKN